MFLSDCNQNLINFTDFESTIHLIASMHVKGSYIPHFMLLAQTSQI